MKKATKNTHGGFRPNSGRHQKPDKDDYVKITCMLRKDTVEQLRAGSGSRFFGEFLQHLLDQHPIPSRELYLKLGRRNVIIAGVVNRRRAPKPIAPHLAQFAKFLDKANGRRVK